MCGIAGLVRAPAVQPDAAVIQRMTDVLRHRGPDFGATVIRDNVALGHRRLSIIDLSTEANQPMVSDDGAVAIVFNGEIYNFQAIREEQIRAGHRFRTHSDTEVLLDAWREYGPDCLQRLRGMFAFAIHDRTRGLLFLARDRLGKKPLFYARGPGWFAFGSEIKAVRASGLISNDLDETALVQYVTYGYPVGDRSIFAAIRKLPPGHTLTVRADTPDHPAVISRNWQLRFSPEHGRTETECIGELDRLLSEAVRLRMVSDVPLGAFLSGGVDSSLVTALMCAHTPGRVKTFTIGFREKRFEELFCRLQALSREPAPTSGGASGRLPLAPPRTGTAGLRAGRECPGPTVRPRHGLGSRVSHPARSRGAPPACCVRLPNRRRAAKGARGMDAPIPRRALLPLGSQAGRAGNPHPDWHEAARNDRVERGVRPRPLNMWRRREVQRRASLDASS